ncbi:alpha/beta hydrolase family protein [Flavobacterium sp.]|uniref:alpha/beta hydrolase family protein n=1 Tax=Flavobacterium sp. TaxID=239 RepID=UPI002FDA9CAF
MKKTAFLTLLFLTTLTAFAQDITGDWNGALKVQGIQLRLVFHITKTDTGYTATMDSPDQGAKGIPVTTTTFVAPTVTLEIAAAHIVYTGDLKNNGISGIFKQGGMEFPMDLSRDAIGEQTYKRPQEPKQPYPYYSEDITFTNPKANITLAGTLTLPKKEGVFPVVVLISGSGPQNRNEELLGHKPFLVLSDYLTKHGIAVLRYDDRGIAQSKGDFKTATTADFATDAESAIAYLKTRKEINPKKIGLMGHSEGGLVAPMVAARSKDVSFIVLLAGPGMRGDKLLLLQQELVAKASGATATEIKDAKIMNGYCFDKVINSKDDATLKTDLTQYLTGILKETPKEQKPEGITDEENVAMQVNQITNPWMLYFLRCNPATALEKVKCPVLAVNGAKDLQVPPKENIEGITKALLKSGNKKVTTRVFPNLNHLFQECTTGSPSEYVQIEQTISPIVLEEVTQWIVNRTK